MKKTVVCVMFCAILLCSMSGCYSTVTTADTEQTGEIGVMDSSEIGNEEPIPDNVPEPEDVSLLTTSEAPKICTSEPEAVIPQQEEIISETIAPENITDDLEDTNNNNEYVKSQEEADWVCVQCYLALQQNVARVDKTVDQYNTEIANLRNRMEYNSTQQMTELRQLRERYSNMGMLDSGAYQSAVKSVQQRYSDENTRLGKQMADLQNQRDRYKQDHDNAEHVLYVMAENTGLTYNEVYNLVYIYQDEVLAYLETRHS